MTLAFIAFAVNLYRVRDVVAFAVICFVLSNLFENMSVIAGFPFGFFEHSTATGPRLFNIPLLATPTYMAMGFISWAVAVTVIDRRDRFAQTARPFTTAVVAGVIFSMWDLCNDPVFHTVNGAFVYRYPGPWFGVPLTNYGGWLLTTVAIYAAFAFEMRRRPTQRGVDVLRPKILLQAIAMYAAVAFAGIYRNYHGSARTAELSDGSVWRTADIFSSMSLITVFTMLFVVLLALMQLFQSIERGERRN